MAYKVQKLLHAEIFMERHYFFIESKEYKKIVHIFNSYNLMGPKSHCQWEISMVVLPVTSYMNWLLFACHLTIFISDMEEKIIPSRNDY